MRLLFGLATLLLAQPAYAQSFNCRNARTADEVAICSDAGLSRLDERLSSRFYGLRENVSGPARARLDYEQSRWLDSRHRCGANRACIAASYRSRIADLSGRPVASAGVIERTCVRDARGNQTCAETAR